MPSLYQIDFSQRSLPFNGNIDLYYSKNIGNAALQFYVFSDGKLYNYDYVSESKSLKKKWNTTLVTTETSESRVLYFPEVLEGILMLKTSQGINFYQYRNRNFDLLSKSDDFDENEFYDIYGWNEPVNVIKSGHFYHNQGLVGVLTKHQEYGLKFYAVMKDELFKGNYPIWELRADLSILGNSSQADFFYLIYKRKAKKMLSFGIEKD